MANKLKESENEKNSKSNLFPTISETFEKIVEFSLKINLDFINSIRSHSENNITDLKLKKTKSQMNKITKQECNKIKVSVVKWNDDESVDFNSFLEKKETTEDYKEKQNESQQESANSKSENSQIENEEEKLKSGNKTFYEFFNDENLKIELNFQDFIEKNKSKENEEIWKNKIENSLKLAEPFTLMESSHFPETSNTKIEPKLHKQIKIETRINTKSIETYIQENKSKLTNLDLCIFNSMVKCNTNGNREKSRFEFANKTNSSQTVLEKYSVMNNLISSFFKEETEVLKFDPSQIKSKEEERYYRLFNQSYIMERFE